MFDKKEYMKQYRIENKEKISEQRKQYYRKNIKKKKKYMEQYNKKYYIKNREKLNERNRQWYENNREYVKQFYKKYRSQHCNKKYKTDLKYNLSKNISNAIYLSLRGNKNGRHWESLVGYTINQLMEHLKKTMPQGYNWQDFMEGKLHIDHIIPISAFNFTKPEHINFKRCWGLSNLRLLPAKENRIKKDKIIKPFQLALQI